MSAAGFEPTTLGSGVRQRPPQPVAGVSKSLQVQPVTRDGLSSSSQQNAPISRPFGALVVQAPPPGTWTGGTMVKGPFLTVRGVAARLGVSTAMVYRILEEGDLPHFRVSNAIRVPESGLAHYLRRRRQGRP